MVSCELCCKVALLVLGDVICPNWRANNFAPILHRIEGILAKSVQIQRLSGKKDKSGYFCIKFTFLRKSSR